MLKIVKTCKLKKNCLSIYKNKIKIAIYFMFINNFNENNNCDLPSTSSSIPAVQFMEITNTEIS